MKLKQPKNVLPIAVLLLAAILSTTLNVQAQGGTSKKEVKLYQSKFDFVPGDKIAWFENFADEALGDFPSKWNTNATGEVVKLQGTETKALMIMKDGLYLPLGVSKLPEHFTLQFNLSCNSNFSYYSSPFQVLFAALAAKKEFAVLKQYNPHNKDVVKLWLHPNNAAENAGFSGYELIEKGTKQTSNETNTTQFFAHKNAASVKVAIWRTGARLRVYLNEEKLWDLPQAFEEKTIYNSLVFSLSSIRAQGDQYFISDLRLHTGAPAIKEQLNKGRFVTTGILFDVNSDVIRPESYGLLKQLAEAMKAGSQISYKITGYTDSDGSAEANLELSKKRAASVKNALVKEYGIDAQKLQTEGKGELDPADSNATATGKANNRRVEFTKI